MPRRRILSRSRCRALWKLFWRFQQLPADSLALIELVEGLEEELSERTVGFRIEDEDLEDLKTVRDAIDYVMARIG